MAERHLKILKAVSQIAEILFRSPRWEDEMSSVLSLLGESVQVSRTYLFECEHIHLPECTSNIRFEWVNEGVSPQINNPELHGFSWKHHNLLEWRDVLSRGLPFIAHIDELPEKVDREHFFQQGIKSLVLVPIISDSDPWGFLGFDECRVKREWAERDIESLRSVANILGAAIFRQNAEVGLRIANERFQLAEKAGGIGSWDWNIQTGDLVWSDSIEAMFGFSEGGFGKTYEAFLECVHPEDREKLERAVRASLDEDVEYYCQHRIAWPDDSIHWVLETGEVTRDLQGKPVRMVGVVQDITNAVQVNQALRDSEQRFRDLVESTSDWIWEVDAQGRYTYVSPKVEDVLGYTADEIVGKTPFELMPQREASRITVAFQEIIENLSPISQLINVNIHKNGHEVILETSGVPVIDENGDLLGYRGIDRDITERVLSEKALRESEEILHQFADHVNEVFYVRDMQSDSLIYVSPSYRRLLGQEIPLNEVTLDSLIQMVHPDDQAALIPEINQQAQGKGLDYEFRLILPNGEQKWVWLRTFPIRDSSGHVYRIAGLVEDITQRKQAQEKRLLREIAHKEALVQEVHHRIKNNLQSIIGLLRLQLEEFPELVEVLRRVIGQVQSIALVHGLQGRSSAMYLCEIVHAIGESNKKLCADEDLIEMQIDNTSPAVIREEDMVPIALVINEVLTNAIKHGRKKMGGVKVNFSSEGQSAEITVINETLETDVNESLGSFEGVGMAMIRVLMPREGASIHFSAKDDQFIAHMIFTQPVVSKKPMGVNPPQLDRQML